MNVEGSGIAVNEEGVFVVPDRVCPIAESSALCVFGDSRRCHASKRIIAVNVTPGSIWPAEERPQRAPGNDHHTHSGQLMRAEAAKGTPSASTTS